MEDGKHRIHYSRETTVPDRCGLIKDINCVRNKLVSRQVKGVLSSSSHASSNPGINDFPFDVSAGSGLLSFECHTLLMLPTASLVRCMVSC